MLEIVEVAKIPSASLASRLDIPTSDQIVTGEIIIPQCQSLMEGKEIDFLSWYHRLWKVLFGLLLLVRHYVSSELLSLEEAVEAVEAVSCGGISDIETIIIPPRR